MKTRRKFNLLPLELNLTLARKSQIYLQLYTGT